MARALSECAVKCASQDVKALNMLGMIEFRSGNYVRGIEVLSRASEKAEGQARLEILLNLKRCANDVTRIALERLSNGDATGCISAFNSVIMINNFNWLAKFSINFIVDNLNHPSLYGEYCAALSAIRWNRFEQTFTQSYEDGRVLELLEKRQDHATREKGVYVDIGAHHPLYLSVTAALRFLGWEGIALDPLPGAMEMFHLLRPNDVNLPYAVARTDGVSYINVATDPTLSYVSDEGGRSSGEARVKVETRRIDSVLRAHLPPGRSIDVMNVDVEGGEDSVIDSNDWNVFRPYVLLLEDPAPVTGGEPGERWRRMEALGYAFACQAGHTALYVDQITH